MAHSYPDAQPQHACGAKVIADEVAAADVGATITISGASQLGGDADRITSVVAGDIDMDIQGASALSALYPPMSVVDGAFVFDDSDHLHRFFTSEASQPLKDGLSRRPAFGSWAPGPPGLDSSPRTSRSALPRTCRVFGCGSRLRPSS